MHDTTHVLLHTVKVVTYAYYYYKLLPIVTSLRLQMFDAVAGVFL